MDTTFLTNKRLTDREIGIIESLSREGDEIVFAVVGEISNRARYGTCVLLATRSALFTYDFELEKCSERYTFADILDIYNKRMYGNGVMRLRTKDGVLSDVFRFTFSVAALCDAVLGYVKEIGRAHV